MSYLESSSERDGEREKQGMDRTGRMGKEEEERERERIHGDVGKRMESMQRDGNASKRKEEEEREVQGRRED